MPETAVKEQFACPTCGAGMQFSPEAGQLKCAHCGQTRALIASTGVTAHEFTGVVASHLLQPITAQALQVTCTGCGSVVAFEPPEVAGREFLFLARECVDATTRRPVVAPPA